VTIEVMHIAKRTVLAGCAALVAVVPAAAQQASPPPRDEVVARVVAVVGDSVILDVNLEELLVRLEAQGATLPAEGPERDALRREALEQRISELLLIQAALRDTMIVVAEDDIARRVQLEVDQRQQAVGGPVAFDNALRASGLSLRDFREMLAQQLRESMLIQQYLGRAERERQAPPVSEADMRRFLEDQREGLGHRPPTITFQQVVVPPQPSAAALAEARALADTVLLRLRSREDFAQLARRFSDDPQTRDLGGDLGFFKRGDMVPAFERVVFDMLRPGEISPPVLTVYGYHVVKLERVRGSERQARHILISVDRSIEDVERARVLADSLAAELRAGRARFTDVHRDHGDPDEEFHVTDFSLDRADQLPPPYDEILPGARTGDLIGPFAIGPEDGLRKWAIVRVLRYDDSGEWSLDDPVFRDQVRRRLEEMRLRDEIIRELRQRTYVEIRL
jgi:peptidyl-prolyl cis-trans isomerase SurA